MDDTLERVYGRGWAFPPRFTLHEGARMVAGADDVRESLVILFSTLPGERVMRTQYGCDLHRFMFANIGSALTTEVESAILDGVLECEPRAEVTLVDVAQDLHAPNVLRILLCYQLRGSDIDGQVAGTLDVSTGRSAIL